MADHDVLILGGGPAGCTAALYCARASLRTLVVERGAAGGQMANTPAIENYPGVAATGGIELGQAMREQAVSFGAKFRTGDVTAVHLDGGEKRIVLAGGETISARAVILAMGASPRRLDVPGEERLRGRGVSYCATCDGMFFRRKTVAVVGGGNTAVEDALLLSKLCEQVYLIHRRDQFRAAAVSVAQLRETANIQLVLGETVEAILGEERVAGVRLHSGSTLECAGVFVAVGNRPNSDLVRGQLPLDDGGYVLAGEDTKTALPGVCAAGDLRSKPLRQIVTAAADGAVAAVEIEKYLLHQ